MVILVQKSTGLLLPGNALPGTGVSYYGENREPDQVSVRSAVPVAVAFLADDLVTPVSLASAAGVLTFTAQPAADDYFTIGTVVYTAVTALTGAANEVLRGANLAAFLANLVGAIAAAGTGGQAAGATYGIGTVANASATAAGAASTIALTAAVSGAAGNSVATVAISAAASFGAATLTGGELLNLDIKPVGEYDADFTLPTPSFTAPANVGTGFYTGTLSTNIEEAITLLDPNNSAVGTLTFTAQPAPTNLVTVGTTVYTAVAALAGAANEFLIGASLAATIANLLGAINAGTASGQCAGTTYGIGTVANPLATAAPGTGTAIVLTATAAAEGTSVATTTTGTAASFGASTLTVPTIATAVEPGLVDLMAQLSWGVPGAAPNRSQQWTITLDNSIRHGGEALPTTANPPYDSSTAVNAAVVQAAAAAATLAGLAAVLAALTPVANLYNAGMLFLAPQSLDFRLSRNAMFAAAA